MDHVGIGGSDPGAYRDARHATLDGYAHRPRLSDLAVAVVMGALALGAARSVVLQAGRELRPAPAHA